MSDSASSLRQRQTAATERALQALARRLAAERGLAGFTIEELCSEVGVSRRTFFNYFASKENAVLGIPLRRDDEDLEQAFTGSTADPLLDALLQLHAARFERLQLTREDVDHLTRAFEHDPRLLAQFLTLVAEGEQRDALLVTTRQGWDDDDPRAGAAVQLAGVLLRPAFETYLADGGDFLTLLRDRLTLAHSLLTL